MRWSASLLFVHANAFFYKLPANQINLILRDQFCHQDYMHVWQFSP